MGIFACTLIIGAASFATAGVPDLNLSGATTAAGATTVVLYNAPNGGGAAFSGAVAAGGIITDATISLTLLDGAGAAINLYPFEDMWIESGTFIDADNPGLVGCTGGTSADASTNAAGFTQWSVPLNAGGWSLDNTVVVINGAPLTGTPSMPIWHNSADINGDGNINLSDVQLFAGDFFAPAYNFRSDFVFDAIVNLSDIVPLAQGVGASCP
jgi:hypothetical protein